MNLILANAWLDYIEEHGFWPKDSTLPARPIMLVAAVLVGVLLARQLWLGGKRVYERLKPTRAFHEIAEQLGLGWSDQLWLWRLARRESLSSPLALLVCRSTLMHYARQQADRLTATQGETTMARAGRISAILFPVAAQA